MRQVSSDSLKNSILDFQKRKKIIFDRKTVTGTIASNNMYKIKDYFSLSGSYSYFSPLVMIFIFVLRDILYFYPYGVERC